ncbi:MAG: ribosome silencing factor [Alphaproteobacteria bacterium]|jgi:ribosome-associated protein|nr:ribosome silencing factor [Alphaproteobacteria bacterium]
MGRPFRPLGDRAEGCRRDRTPHLTCAAQPSAKKELTTIAKRQKSPPPPTAPLALVEASLDDDKGIDVVVIDLQGKTSIADHMVVASGRSQRHVSAMAQHLIHELKQAGHRPLGIEGQTQGDWVLIDVGDVIVHLFRPEVRDFYNLEKMWSVEMPELIAG